MKRNKFSLSKYKLLSCYMGDLIPIGWWDVLPGDTFQQSTSILARLQPLLAPVMHPCHITIHHWYVPLRIIWEDFEDFITGGRDGSTAPTFPTITTSWTNPTTGDNLIGSLMDYLGVPTDINGLEISALPLRAYALIYNEWYRDQDLIDPLTIDLTSGADTTTNKALQKRGWGKDYFTTARPFTQKGPDITIPLDGDAPVTGLGMKTDWNASSDNIAVTETDGGTPTYTKAAAASSAAGLFAELAAGSGAPWTPNINADLSAVTMQIADLRLAMALQRWEEARARYGSRYTEYLRYYGVRSSDARLQRPEYLGGGKQTLQFSEVLATAESEDVPIGALKGHGIAAMRSNRYRRFFEEHGIVMTLMNIQPKTMYVGGLKRAWNRRTKEDFFTKELETIGQQEILNKEIDVYHGSLSGTFGYQDRYDEYRREESDIAGLFRTEELDYWHMARKFAGLPVLNGSFVNVDPTRRIFAEQTEHNCLIMASHSVQARRMLSKIGYSKIM